jgi:hypothetical protein
MAPLKTYELANIHGTLWTFLHGQFALTTWEMLIFDLGYEKDFYDIPT